MQARLDVSLSLGTFHGQPVPKGHGRACDGGGGLLGSPGSMAGGMDIPPQPPHDPYACSNTIPEPGAPPPEASPCAASAWRLFQLSPDALVSRDVLSSGGPSTRPRQPSGVVLADRRERQREAAALP
ncbi:hypothetical protein GCM10023193_46390 [Planotetraspora kaengkrachanensis]|uniref:Uncharacterized protein n=1 Tax=Planotetraspora kaengkrachanensis TaxID=575193 RepID=A0A8J3PS69_9ACTN|nr:hypothetical protein Pka01_37080 [Planotetraspora kaengkrachanensis]